MRPWQSRGLEKKGAVKRKARENKGAAALPFGAGQIWQGSSSSYIFNEPTPATAEFYDKL